MTATGGPSANSVPADQLRKTRSARRWSAIEDFWSSASAVRTSRGVRGEEDDGRERDGREVAGGQVAAVAEAGAAGEVEREPGQHPRDGELGEVEDDPVDGAAPDQVGGERGGHLDHHHLGDPVREEEREGERRGEGLLAHLAVDLDREQLADQDEPGEDPELGVEGAEVARAERRQRDQYGDARRADEPQVEGERGL